MKSLEGFVKISALLNNVPNNINTIGELSTQALTYSQDVQTYENPSFPGSYDFNVFSSLDLITNAYTTPNTTVLHTTIELVSYAMTYSGSHIQPYSSSSWLTYINGILGTRISTLSIGNFIASLDGGTALPEWVSFTSLEDNLTNVKIWLADASFKSQYDKYLVVPSLPLTNIDDFFNLSYTDLKNAINTLTPVGLLNKAITLQNNKPATNIAIENFNYIPPNVTLTPFSVPWYASVYSNYGNSIELIKAAICTQVLSQSTHSRPDWVGIFPDLFKQTEFILIPRWELVAVPDLSVQLGLYSPVATASESLSHVISLLPSYGSAHITPYMQVITSIYKYLNICVIGGTDNINNEFSFTNVFPDYMPIPTMSLDFNRMTVNTQNWSILLNEMLIIAEQATGTVSLPSNMRSVIRDGKTYISAVYNNIEYLVFAKSNLSL